ncbi:hypothetical protein GBA52_026799 [Prunus armeniaca]|nr:hypothetical protein GBA52_026799 [Prunus armeniaca]
MEPKRGEGGRFSEPDNQTYSLISFDVSSRSHDLVGAVVMNLAVAATMIRATADVL